MLKFSILFGFGALACLATCQQVSKDTERPFLRILAPKFICNDKKKQVEQSSNITIGLQTREGQKLRYQISIDFEMLDGFKNQQHTLSIWKNVRLLQKKFSSISDEISLKNQIEINAQELTPQVVYTFKIAGIDDENISSEVQNFSITYKGGELKAVQDNLGDGVSLLLFSSEFFYDDMELLAVAEVSFCNPINEFSYRWKVDGLEASEIESITSNSLKLPPGTLKAGSGHQVTVTVVNSESLIMATATLPVNIVGKEFQLQNAPMQCSVEPGREVPFQALIFRQPNSEIQSITWSCSQDCSESFTNSNVLNQLVTFSKEGSFEIQSKVTINEVTKLSTTKVGVDMKVIPLVQMKYLPTQPLNIMKPNEVVVTVLNLIPKCFASWNIMSGEGFADFKAGVEGNFTDMGFIVIKDFEEYFLQELVDYDNNTLSKDVTLSLPAGCLNPNANYKFRLTITCPEPLKDGEEQAQRANVTSFYEIVISTNGPPETLPLVINPMNGIPMKQRFKFSTGAAKDSPIDFPLKYTFGYIVDNLTVVIGTYYENMVSHTQLPFSERIETFYDVCDNNAACVRVSGPIVSADMIYNFTSEEFDYKFAEFEATLGRKEYSESLNSAVVLLMTQRKVNKESSSLESKMLSLMEKEIEKLKSSDESSFLYQQQIIEFVKMSKNLMNIMTVIDEKFIEDLLTLTETISRSAKKMKRSIVLQNKNVVNHDSDYIKNVLSLSEILLNSNNSSVVQREKVKCVEKVHKFVASMCNDKNVNSQLIESKFSSFEVVKVFSPQLSIESLTFPGAEKSTIIFSSTGNFPSKYVCVAKIRFSIDMFASDSTEMFSPVYETIVMDEDLSGTFKPLQANDLSSSVTIDLASKSSSSSSLTCFVRKNENWSSDDCVKQKSNVTDHVTCKCKTTGLESFTMKLDKQILKPTVSSEITVYNFDSTTKKSDQTPFTFLSTRTESTTRAFTFLSTRTTVLNKVEPRVTSEASFITQAEILNTVNHVAEITTLSLVEQQEVTKLPTSNDQPSISNSGIFTNQPTVKSQFVPTTLSVTQDITTKTSTVIQDLANKSGQPEFQASTISSNQLEAVNPASISNQSGLHQMSSTRSAVMFAPTSATSTSKLSSVTSTSSVEKVIINTTASNSTSQNLQNVNDSSASWTLIILLLVFFLIILILFMAHRCRHYVDLHTNLPMRNPSVGIKYAKYHDEFTMRG